MIVLVQRVSQSSVKIEKQVKATIGIGLLVLLGITHDDNEEDIDWLTNKLINLRIFSDTEGKMNHSVMDINGEVMVVSQFTLHASTKKGNRPSYINAARPEYAIPLYESFINKISEKLGRQAKSGEFGANMKIELVNDGPVTIHIDSKNRI